MFSVKEQIDVGPLPHGRGKFRIFVTNVTLAVKDPKSIKRPEKARVNTEYKNNANRARRESNPAVWGNINKVKSNLGAAIK